jgi:hypothetical protein
MSRLGGDTYYRVARTEADEDLLQRWLASVHPEVRTAFISALLVVDGQATIGQVVAGWRRITRRLVPPEPTGTASGVEEAVDVVPRLCGYCTLPLPDVSGPGRPPLYHGDCLPKADALRRAQARRACNGAMSG